MTLHVYIGFDAIDHLAYRVAERSILEQASKEVAIHPLRDWQLRGEGLYTRQWKMLATGQKWDLLDEKPHSTEFSYTRFLTPIIHKRKRREGPALFIDADMMFRADIVELFDLADSRYDVMVVKHDHKPPEATKIVGVVQQQYERKNWASVMLFPHCSVALDVKDVNTKHRDYLTMLEWADDDKIGELPEEWNWLDGWSDGAIDPKNVHHTRGTPDMPDWADVAYADEWWKWAREAGWLGMNEL